MSSAPGRNPCDNHPFQNYTWVQLHEVIVDKDYQLECLEDDLHKLCNVEFESKRKGEIITVLRKEVAEYKKCTQTKDARYASVDQKLYHCESHLLQRTQEFEEQKSQLESRLKSISAKSSVMQKDVLKLSDSKARLEEEVKGLRAQRECNVMTISTLRKQLAEKKSHIGSLQDKTKRMHPEYQDLQMRLEILQADQERLFESERQQKAEVQRLKNLSSNELVVQQKCDFIEQELTKEKWKENEMEAEIKKLESELSQLCGHIATCAQTHTTGINFTKASDLLTKITTDYLKARDMISSLEQDQRQDRQTLLLFKNDVIQLWKDFQDGLSNDVVSAHKELVSKIKETRIQDENFNNVLVMMRETMNILCSMEEQSHGEELDHISDHIKSCYISLQGQPAAEDVTNMVTNITSALKSSAKEIAKLNQRLVEKELENGASLTGAVTALRQDEDQQMYKLAQKVKLEEEEKKKQELQKQKELLEQEKQEVILKEQLLVKSISRELTSAKLALESGKKVKNSLLSELSSTETKLHEARLTNSEIISFADSQRRNIECQFNDEMMGHKEQAHQHAITIVALEKKLLSMMKTCKVLQEENQTMKAQLDSKVTTSTAEIRKRDVRLQKNADMIGTLRNQFTLVSIDNSRKDCAVKELNNEMQKLDNAVKQNNEEQKLRYCKEISDLHLTMAKQETIIEQQISEIDALNKALSDNVSLLDSMRLEQTKNREEFREIQKTISKGNDLATPGRLTEVGHSCLQEKHGSIIKNQKTALSQLRQTVRELELAKPPVGSHQATLKELSRVRHEQAKLKYEGINLCTLCSSKKKPEEVEKNTQFTSSSIEESKSKEAVLHQLEDTLQCSEKMYMALVEAICTGMPDLSEHSIEIKQLVAIDKQSKKRELLRARKKFADTVCRQLQAKPIGMKLGKEDKKESPEEIIADLEAMLNKTAEELDQQKRLNQALLRRKSFRELQQMNFMQKPRHICRSATVN